MERNTFSLAGKTVLITGASSGIGAHYARTVADAGARVVIGARRIDRLEQLAGEIRASGGEVLAVAMDVTSRASVEAAFDAAESEFGVVDVLVNNAGIGAPRKVLEITEEDWRAMHSTNLDGVWRVAQVAAQRLVKAGRSGSFINIASMLGLRVAPHLSHYCTSKAAVIQLTRSLALELVRHGIRVNAIAPGYFQTELNGANVASEASLDHYRAQVPMRRLGQLEELDGPLLLLASDAGSFMTGAVLSVDGGQANNRI